MNAKDGEVKDDKVSQNCIALKCGSKEFENILQPQPILQTQPVLPPQPVLQTQPTLQPQPTLTPQPVLQPQPSSQPISAQVTLTATNETTAENLRKLGFQVTVTHPKTKSRRKKENKKLKQEVQNELNEKNAQHWLDTRRDCLSCTFCTVTELVPNTFDLCSKCEFASYCSKTHQEAHWVSPENAHRNVCKNLSQWKERKLNIRSANNIIIKASGKLFAKFAAIQANKHTRDNVVIELQYELKSNSFSIKQTDTQNLSTKEYYGTTNAAVKALTEIRNAIIPVVQPAVVFLFRYSTTLSIVLLSGSTHIIDYLSTKFL